MGATAPCFTLQTKIQVSEERVISYNSTFLRAADLISLRRARAFSLYFMLLNMYYYYIKDFLFYLNL